MPPISPISSTTIAKIKSEKAWLRKSRCMEFPGPLPTTWLVAMAIRACAICASLSISNLAAGTSSLSKKPETRFCQVSKRWSPGVLCSVLAGIAISIPTATPPTSASNPSIPNSFFADTRPMNIIMHTTPNNSIAVDRFSGAISMNTNPVRIMMYLKALGLAPYSSCFFDRINETAMMTAILASSDGWNCNPMKVIQRAAPLTRSPVMIPINVTNANRTRETGYRNTGNT